MKARKPVSYLLFAMCLIMVPSGRAQSDTSTRPGPTPQEIDRLLLGESQALERYEQDLAPAIRCDSLKNARQSCRALLIKITDDAEQAKQAISRYQTYGGRQPVDLFDTYIILRTVLEDIEILALVDEFNGHGNREPISAAYNSFIKITGAWFTGEIRKTILAANP